ncbi:unnamed protein product, partial [Sphenostylis stenocarpa]
MSTKAINGEGPITLLLVGPALHTLTPGLFHVGNDRLHAASFIVDTPHETLFR